MSTEEDCVASSISEMPAFLSLSTCEVVVLIVTLLSSLSFRGWARVIVLIHQNKRE